MAFEGPSVENHTINKPSVSSSVLSDSILSQSITTDIMKEIQKASQEETKRGSNAGGDPQDNPG